MLLRTATYCANVQFATNRLWSEYLGGCAMSPQSGPRRILILVVVFLLCAVAACGKPHETETDTADDLPSSVPPATKDVASVTWNLVGGEPNSLDPVKIFSGPELQVNANTCESLLRLDDSGSTQPGLATSIDRPDDTSYVVHLRDGVEFFDGKPMTADDVVFSLDRIRDPSAGSYFGSFARNVADVSATDDQTVTITLKRPDAVFYAMLASPMGQVVQKAYVERVGAKYGSPSAGVMCTGPYSLAEWNQGSEIVLEANPSWWGRDEQPVRTESATFTFVTDEATSTQALLNGDIDGSFGLAGSTIDGLRAADNGQVYVGPSTMQLVLVPTELGPRSNSALANRQIRHAFAKSIDYDGILASVYGGAAEPLRAAMPPGGWGDAKSIYSDAYGRLEDPARDLDAAKNLIAESGIKKPHVTLAVPTDIPSYVTIGEIIKSNAEQAGFDVTLQTLPTAAYRAFFSDEKARSKVDVFLADWYADIPEPTQLYTQFGIPGGSADFGGYDNPKVAGLLKEATATLDDTKRAELVVQAQQTLTDDLVWIPLAYPLQTLFLSDDLGGASTAFPSVMYSPWLHSVGGR